MCLVVVLGLLSTVGILAAEFPTSEMVLHEGNNLITLSIKNGWNRDIRNLTAQLGSEELPSWLKFAGNEESVTILTAEDREYLLTFALEADSVPNEESADITIILGDDAGNLWAVPITVSIDGIDNNPQEFETALSINFPNPFNPQTTIPYTLAETTNVKITIYNILGQKIRTLLDGQKVPGAYSVVWDGRDEQGRSVSSGVYLCKFAAGNYQTVQRMMLLE